MIKNEINFLVIGVKVLGMEWEMIKWKFCIYIGICYIIGYKERKR